MGKVHAVATHGWKLGMWVVCMHCERAYEVGEYREIKSSEPKREGFTYQMCPYEGCDGDTVIDAWPWHDLRRTHPKYPKIPERGRVYPIN